MQTSQSQKNDRKYHNLPIMTLNIDGQNSPKKRHAMAGWIKKQDMPICCL
jgi:hypothetical protein